MPVPLAVLLVFIVGSILVYSFGSDDDRDEVKDEWISFLKMMFIIIGIPVILIISFFIYMYNY